MCILLNLILFYIIFKLYMRVLDLEYKAGSFNIRLQLLNARIDRVPKAPIIKEGVK